MEEYLSTKKVMRQEEDVLKYLGTIASGLDEDSITIICAGHFMLAMDAAKEHLIPALYHSADAFAQPSMRAFAGLFPEYTWELGCKLFGMLQRQAKPVQLSLLVNDWQMVPEDPERAESAPNKYREDFYKHFNGLPDAYVAMAAPYLVDTAKDLYRTPSGEFYLREVRLKDRFLRKLKNLLKQDVCVSIGSCSIAADDSGVISYQQNGEADIQLATRRGTGCAGGITQMLLDISADLEPRFSKLNFINFMPNSCTNPVNTATNVALDWLTESPDLEITVHNLFLEGTGTEQITDFFSAAAGGVTGYAFKNHDNE
jgi:hypothetical protein